MIEMPDNRKLYGDYKPEDWQLVLDELWAGIVSFTLAGNAVQMTWIVLFDRNGEPVSLLVPVTLAGEELPRALVHHVMRFVLKDTNAVAYLLVTEAWCVSVNKRKLSEFQYGDVSRHPDREECLTLAIVTRDLGTYTRTGRIVRKDGRVGEGEVVAIETLDFGESSSLVGGAAMELFERDTQTTH